MARALQLAAQGLYTTDPNPRVGCVLVKDDVIVGEGWHKRAGGPHAEVEALREAGANAHGATAYVTLEPCCHHGRTPPCSQALLVSGVSKVIAAQEDPNPRVAGQGLAQLRAAGLDVGCGLLAGQAEQLNRGFCMRMRSGIPFVVSKLAMSLDGRTALANGESKWITSPEARADVHRLRASCSAILTGSATVLADDPSLTARLPDPECEVLQPLRIILDTYLRTPPHAIVAQQPGQTFLFTCCEDEARHRPFEQAGFLIKVLPADVTGRVDLPAVQACLGQMEINTLLIEAGATLNGALLQARLIDEWWIYMAPCILGDAGKGLFHLPALSCMQDRPLLRLMDSRQLGPDLRLRFTRG